MRAYLVMFLVILVPTAGAAFYSVGLSDLLASAASVFFRVAPAALAVGALIGLLSHRRA
jgi:hypothetical protein